MSEDAVAPAEKKEAIDNHDDENVNNDDMMKRWNNNRSLVDKNKAHIRQFPERIRYDPDVPDDDEGIQYHAETNERTPYPLNPKLAIITGFI